MSDFLLEPDSQELDIPGGEPELVKLSSTAFDSSQNRFVDRFLAVIVTFFPIIAVVIAIYLHYTGWYTISWIEISLCIFMHALAVIGIELGYHRLFAHGSFIPSRWLKIVLAVLGSMGFQGPVIWWAAVHRKHHRHSDRPNDPHSIYIGPSGTTEYNRGFFQLFKGFIHSHVGWIWTPDSIRSPGWNRYVRDLYRDSDIWKIHINYLYFLVAGLIIPGIIGGLLHGNMKGFFLGVLWGGFVRIFVMNHLTYWSINTLSHSVGPRPYLTADRSTNSIAVIFAVPTLGQSYHNNHHAFPTSATMSHQWYEVDLGWYILKALKGCGQIKRLNLPTKAMMTEKLIKSNKQNIK